MSKSTLRTYAQLCRLPAVFTAIADVVMGAVVLRGIPDSHATPQLISGVATSCGLYLAGMVLNDVFDREVDARERPNRPIPSGRVSLPKAIGFAAVLITIGLVAAKLTGFPCVLISLILLVNVFLYDGWAKHTPFGPMAMGGCRFLNALLGGSTLIWDINLLLDSRLVPVAAGMGVYVAGVTWFAKKEAEQSGRGGLLFGLGVLNLGLGILAVWMAPVLRDFWAARFDWWIDNQGDPWRSYSILGVIALIVNRRALSAIRDPSPRAVQGAVRVMLLSIITIDATLIYAALGDPGVPIAIGVVAMLAPSFLLGRWMTMT